MSLTTLPDHLLHQILIHLPCTTSFALTHPSLNEAVATATTLSLAHPPPPLKHLHHLTVLSAALQTPKSNAFTNLSALRSLRLPAITTQNVPAAKQLLKHARPEAITLHPSPIITSLIPYLSPSHITALPHHPAFLSHSLTLIHALPLKSFHLHLPQRLLPHDELAALAKHAKIANIEYQLTLPVYDYPFHTPHTNAPMKGLTIGVVLMRYEALWTDLQGWDRLERISILGAEKGVLDKLLYILKTRLRKVIIEEREEFDFGVGVKARRTGRVCGGFWPDVRESVLKAGVTVDVTDCSAGRGRDFVTLLLWRSDVY